MYIDKQREIVNESTLQIAVIEYCNKISKHSPSVGDFFHCPNGGARSGATASKLKLEGVKPGVPDLIWMVPKLQYHGLCIELKFGSNKASKEQIDWLETRNNLGYSTLVSNNLLDIIAHIDYYFSLERDNELFRRFKNISKIS